MRGQRRSHAREAPWRNVVGVDMQQAQERQRQVRREAQHYGLLVGYAGGVLAVLQVSVGGAAAYENQPTILSLQRSLVNLSLGGGANPIPSLQQLLPMWT